MNKNLSTILLASFAFGLGFGLNNIAFSDNAAPLKIGYVNVPKLLESSKTLKAADQARAKSTQEMLKWYDTTAADIQSQQTDKAKEAAIKKYEGQLTQKKKTIKDAYSKKISEVDSQLSAAINQKAKELNYDIVLRKDTVLYGGEDITSHILPLVK